MILRTRKLFHTRVLYKIAITLCFILLIHTFSYYQSGAYQNNVSVFQTSISNKIAAGMGASQEEGGPVDVELDYNNPDDKLRILFSKDKYIENNFKVRNYHLEDKRLLPAYWLYMINNAGNTDLPSSLPFNWNLLTEFPVIIKENPLLYRIMKHKFNCQKFSRLDRSIRSKVDLPHNFVEFDDEFCHDNEQNEYGLPFTIVKKLDGYFHNYDFRMLYNMIYSITSFPVPQNVMFLNLVGEQESPHQQKSLIYPLHKVAMGYDNSFDELKTFYSNMSQQIIDLELMNQNQNENQDSKTTIQDILTKGVNIPEQIIKLNTIIDQLPYESIPEHPIKEPTLVGGLQKTSKEFNKPIGVEQKLFDWYLPDIVKATPTDSPLLPILERNLDPFYEQDRYYGVSHVKNRKLDHYDWRFFKQETFKTANDLHIAVLHRLARTWFQLCQSFSIATWINHGPLIGWYWDGLVMPFDSDLDTTIPIQSLHTLAKFLNDTLVYDMSEVHRTERIIDDDLKIDTYAELGMRGFYFEINNNYPHRNRYRSGKNNIDARIIDIETGVYIDITALSSFPQGNNHDLKYERDLLKSMSQMEKERFYKGVNYGKFYDGIEFNQGINDEDGVSRKIATYAKDLIHQYDEFLLTGEITTTTTNSGEGEDGDLQNTNPSVLNFANIVNDRNYHAYELIDNEFALLPIFFENTPMYIPANFLELIVREYTAKAITKKYHKNFRFFEELSMWVDYEACPFFNEFTGEFLNDDETEQDLAQTCIENNPRIFRNFNLLKDYTSLAKEYRDTITDFKSTNNPKNNIDLEKMNDLLLKFDGNIIRPEIWARDHLFKKDIKLDDHMLEA